MGECHSGDGANGVCKMTIGIILPIDTNYLLISYYTSHSQI